MAHGVEAGGEENHVDECGEVVSHDVFEFLPEGEIPTYHGTDVDVARGDDIV